MTPPWRTSIRAAATSRSDEVTSELDRALSSVDLGARGLPWWAHLVRLLQWLLILAAVAGGIWLVMGAVSSAESGPWVDPADVAGVPLPLLLLIAGLGLGLVLAVVSRLVVGWAARSRARAADRALRAAIREVSDTLVVQPIEAELASYEAVRTGLNDALR